jgi:hypothetical protein
VLNFQGRGLFSAGLTTPRGLAGAGFVGTAGLTSRADVASLTDGIGVGLDGSSFGGIAPGGGLEEGFAVTTSLIGLLDEKGAALAGAGLAGTAAAAFSIGLSSP